MLRPPATRHCTLSRRQVPDCNSFIFPCRVKADILVGVGVPIGGPMTWASVDNPQGDGQGAWEDSDGGGDARDVDDEEVQVCGRHGVSHTTQSSSA